MHNQNGHAEKAIRDLQDAARTMLLHAQRHWPSAITTHLWPYAINMAADVHNHLPAAGEENTPMERFSSSKIHPSLKHFHHFGCPVYVLNSKMASGKKMPKWEDRTRVAIYLGKSPNHARSVSLVLSLTTGMISPQYHCQFDDLFETVSSKGVMNVPASQWQEKAFFVSNGEEARETMLQPPAAQTLTTALAPTEQAVPLVEPVAPPTQERREVQQQPTETPPPPRAQAPATTRSGRQVRKPTAHADFVAYQALNQWEEEDEQDGQHPLMSYKATADPDTMYLHEAMREPDKDKFLVAMEREMKDHMQHWEMVLRSSVPTGVKVFSSVWQMKRKRRIETKF